MKGWDFLEALDDEDEGVEVEGNRRGDDVGLAPGSGKVALIEPVDGEVERNKAQDSNDDAGRDAVKGEEESGDARSDGGPEKDSGQHGCRFASDQAEEDDEAGGDGYEAEEDVEDGVFSEHGKIRGLVDEECSRNHARWRNWGGGRNDVAVCS